MQRVLPGFRILKKMIFITMNHNIITKMKEFRESAKNIKKRKRSLLLEIRHLKVLT